MRTGWDRLLAVAVCAAVFTLAGCEGDDGDDGRDGADGSAGLACWDLNENGVGDLPDEDLNGDGVVDVLDCNALANQPPGGGTPTNAVETCSVCHDSGSIADSGAAHALPPIESVSNISFAVNGADLDVTFDLAADGSPAEGYDQIQRGYRTNGLVRTDICNAPSRGDPCDPASLARTENGGGNYTIKVLGGAVAADVDRRYLFRVGAGDDRDTRTYFYADSPATPVEIEPLVVSAESCNACHGPERLSGVHGGYYPAADGGEPCVVCHGVEDTDLETPPGTLVPSLAAVSHGLHSSIWEEDGELIEVTYPTYMNNCLVCHDTEEFLAAANSMPITTDACFSCHGDIDGIPFDEGAAAIHANFDENTDCTVCHQDGGVAGSVVDVTDAHNGGITERDGVIWDGLDTSVTEGAKFVWEITDVADDGTNLSISWQASYDGAGVDPCNATGGVGAPVFFGDGEGNLSILRNYAQGEDFILGTREDRAGQPGGTPAVTAENTTCSGNVATTVVPVEETEAMYGRVAIQGKPRIPNVDPDPDPDFAEEYGTLMPVRAFTPTYDWVIGTGGAAPPRRALVDSSLCLSCHVGSLYQHGGNRVDNVDMCYLCHNPAANDQYVRVDDYSVDPSEAYDGRAGQAFGIKEMVHAVHPAGATGNRIVIYRGRGIYGWATDESQLSNWPGNGRFPVFGSDDGTGSPVEQNHVFHAPTYPRGLYDCAACHVEDLASFPDATKAMATTVETGEPPFGDQTNDVLEGVQTSSCVTCHADSATKSHAYQNGWTPQAFEEGRETIIEANQ